MPSLSKVKQARHGNETPTAHLLLRRSFGGDGRNVSFFERLAPLFCIRFQLVTFSTLARQQLGDRSHPAVHATLDACAAAKGFLDNLTQETLLEDD
jgi:hypothetical protein